MTQTTSAWPRRAAIGALVVAALVGAAALGPVMTASRAAEEAFVIPPPQSEAASETGLQKAVFAGGCFWGVQGVFQHVKGVTGAVSGYAGGSRDHAAYELVGTGRTGHAEAVEITYDPAEVSYGELLHVFFSVAHNATQLNYQGPDRGPQYRSAIFPANAEQERLARDYISQLDATGILGADIVTTLEGSKPFYPAEDYHQDFMTLNPSHPYIVFNDLPKVENLKRLFPGLYRDDPVLVSEAAGNG